MFYCLWDANSIPVTVKPFGSKKKKKVNGTSLEKNLLYFFLNLKKKKSFNCDKMSGFVKKAKAENVVYLDFNKAFALSDNILETKLGRYGLDG